MQAVVPAQVGGLEAGVNLRRFLKFDDLLGCLNGTRIRDPTVSAHEENQPGSIGNLKTIKVSRRTSRRKHSRSALSFTLCPQLGSCDPPTSQGSALWLLQRRRGRTVVQVAHPANTEPPNSFSFLLPPPKSGSPTKGSEQNGQARLPSGSLSTNTQTPWPTHGLGDPFGLVNPSSSASLRRLSSSPPSTPQTHCWLQVHWPRRTAYPRTCEVLFPPTENPPFSKSRISSLSNLPLVRSCASRGCPLSS